MSTRTETVLAYLKAAFEGDYDTLASVVSDQYVWVDRFREITASTSDELAEAMEDDAASNPRELVVERVVETVDGEVVLQATLSGTHSGTFAGFPASGRKATIACCEIFTFDDHDRIVREECYQDLASWMTQWGIIEPLPPALFGFRGARETP
jgi:steroid delta-isomerase-like uncharacterized protein